MSEIGEDSQKTVIKLIPVIMALIMAARPYIFSNNLYAVDAIHSVTAIQSNTDYFITFDGDFKKFRDLEVINPNDQDFKQKIIDLKGSINTSSDK